MSRLAYFVRETLISLRRNEMIVSRLKYANRDMK